MYRKSENSSWLCILLHSPVTPSLLSPNILLRHPQPTFLLQCERPSFTSIDGQKEEAKEKLRRSDNTRCKWWWRTGGYRLTRSELPSMPVCLLARFAALGAVELQLKEGRCACDELRALCCSRCAELSPDYTKRIWGRRRKYGDKLPIGIW